MYVLYYNAYRKYSTVSQCFSNYGLQGLCKRQANSWVLLVTQNRRTVQASKSGHVLLMTQNKTKPLLTPEGGEKT
jgi:hypothetical protein